MTDDVPSRGAILFVRGGALGDFVLTLPVLAALFATGRRVDVVCAPKHLPLVRLCGEPGIAYDILGEDSAWTFGGISPVKYAEAVCFSDARARELPISRVFSVSAQPLPDVPAWQHFSSVWPCNPAVVLGSRGPDTATEGPIVIAPGASSSAKTWPLERWFRLADALRADNVPVRIVGGPLEPWAEYRPELPELIQLFSNASAYIGPDSGPAHLAARLGTPTHVVFTDPARTQWAPLGAVVLTGELPVDTVLSTLTAARS